MPEKTVVLVTAVGGDGVGYGVVKTLRIAGRYRIIGADMSPESIGLQDVDDPVLLPPSSSKTYMRELLAACAKRRVRVLIPGSEAELSVVSEYRARIRSAGVLPLVNSSEVIRLCMDKWATMNFLRDNGFPHPKFALVRSKKEIPGKFVLPAVIKPSVGGGGSSNTFLAQDMAELKFACDYIIRQGHPAIVQEYVGTPDDEYTVGVLSTLDGAFIGSIAMRRRILSGLSNRIRVANRTGRKELTPVLAISSGVSQGEFADFTKVRSECERLAAALGNKGPLNIQCRFVNGKLYPFEINPRFSGTTCSRAMVGFNEPDILIRHHLMGEKIKTPVAYEHAKVLRSLAERKIAAPRGVKTAPRKRKK